MRLMIACGVACCFIVSTVKAEFTSSNLPIIVINTNGQEIPNDPKIDATMGIINNGEGARNNTVDAFNEYNGHIGIEVRGQSSQMFPMKSYSIELHDDNGEDNDHPLFGLPKESDWVMYAPYTDKTLMRNFLAYTMSNELGHWAAHCRFVEVVLNGQYVGIYVFMEKIKRNKGRVNIKKLEEEDIEGDDVTGGYIFSIDKEADAWFSGYQPPNNSDRSIQFAYVYPKGEDILQPQKEYIKSYVDSFENALNGDDFQTTDKGFRKYADENSFIDYFIVNEVSRNVDGYRLSSYFYKDRNSVDNKIYVGPVWDYDLAFRNADYCSGSEIAGWAYKFNDICSNDTWLVPFWWNRFMQDTAFKAHLLCRWKQVRAGILSESHINHLIDSVYTLVGEAQQRHFTQWPVLGTYVWPNPEPIPASYDGEISALKTWIAGRLAWIDNNLTQTGSCSAPSEIVNLRVVQNNNDAVINWETKAINADEFIIDRSLNGIDFTQITTVQKQEDAGYQYTDANITKLNSATVYYRLRYLDNNGASVFTGKILLQVLADFAVSIVPNPIISSCNVVINTNRAQTIHITITDAGGRKTVQLDKPLTVGINTFNFKSSAWAKGIYILHIVTGDKTSKSFNLVR